MPPAQGCHSHFPMAGNRARPSRYLRHRNPRGYNTATLLSRCRRHKTVWNGAGEGNATYVLLPAPFLIGNVYKPPVLGLSPLGQSFQALADRPVVGPRRLLLEPGTGHPSAQETSSPACVPENCLSSFTSKALRSLARNFILRTKCL